MLFIYPGFRHVGNLWQRSVVIQGVVKKQLLILLKPMVANQCFNQSKAIIESLNQKGQERKLGFPQVPAQLR